MAKDGKAYMEGHPTCSRARASSLSTLDLSRWRALRSRRKSQLVPAIPKPLITMFSNTGLRSGASLPPAVKVYTGRPEDAAQAQRAGRHQNMQEEAQ